MMENVYNMRIIHNLENIKYAYNNKLILAYNICFKIKF